MQLDEEQGRRGVHLHSCGKVVPTPPPPFTTHSTEIARKRQTLIRLHVRNKAMREAVAAGTAAATAASLHVLFPASGHRQHIASVFRNYYPEGGWGYVVLLCAFLSVFMVEGAQHFVSFSFLHISFKFVVRDSTSVSGRTTF